MAGSDAVHYCVRCRCQFTVDDSAPFDVTAPAEPGTADWYYDHAAPQASVPISSAVITTTKGIIDARAATALAPTPKKPRAPSLPTTSTEFPSAGPHAFPATLTDAVELCFGRQPSSTAATAGAAADKVAAFRYHAAPFAAAPGTGREEQRTTRQVLGSMLQTAALVSRDFPVCSSCWAADIFAQHDEALKQATLIEELRGVATCPAEDLALVAPQLTAARRDAALDDSMNFITATPPPPPLHPETDGVAAVAGSAATNDSDAVAAVAKRKAALLAEIAAVDAELQDVGASLQCATDELRAMATEEAAVAGGANSLVALRSISKDLTSHAVISRDKAKARSETVAAAVSPLTLLYPICLRGAQEVPTVAGHRLGNLPHEKVQPSEVHAACGYAMLCLKALADAHKFTFSKFELRPNGAAPQLQGTTGKKEALEFFVTAQFFKWSTFGAAWIAFAQCVDEMCSLLKTKLYKFHADLLEDAADAAGGDETPEGVSRIATVTRAEAVLENHAAVFCVRDGDRVGGTSVKHGDVSDTIWTTGVRNVLANLAWAVSADAALSRVPVLPEALLSFTPPKPKEDSPKPSPLYGEQ